MAKTPFGALSAALAGLGTALGYLAVELRADGYEQYVESVSTAAVLMYVTASLVVATWVRDRQTRSD
ncbi:SCO3870 family protein [Streptomyces sp. QH1-20]|uniref:SCO3870 family protein n=1 Tax=Streptomyces sp. QH1-20 TaxID=3240934 RepID=UPI003517C0AA